MCLWQIVIVNHHPVCQSVFIVNFRFLFWQRDFWCRTQHSTTYSL